MSQQAIRTVLHAAAGSGVPDAELLDRFAATRDESAFELLVWRHAAFVQRVCKSVLRDHHAAEDAAQAAFLVLARKAHTFAGRGSVVGWLYRVARRIALRAARDRARRTATAVELDRLADPGAELAAAPDDVALLCEEVDRLPERYRVPVLLCFFEGLTHAEAAARTGWPLGTVAGRLARAKELLSRRLSRKGVGVAAVALALPAGGFVGGTARAAAAFAANGLVPGVEPSVIHLAEGALQAMTPYTWKLTAAAVAVACLTTGVTAAMFGLKATPVPPVAQPTVPVAAPVPPKKGEGERNADAMQRARSQNNLKQILIAIHSYHDANGHLPANIGKDGKPLLSWRVLILPYIEQEQLYKQFKLDEPWDSENNKKLLARMPDVFRVGIELKGETKTYYQGFAGPGTMFEPGKQLKIANVTDGLSNTFAVVEAGPPVEWTRPADIPYDPKKALPKLEGPFANTLIVGFGDGSTQALRRDIGEKTMRLLIEIADGQPVETEDLRGKFPLTAQELEGAKKLLAQNEKLLTDIAAQFKEQQKLLAELAKQPNAKNAKELDLDQLGRLARDLAQFQEEIKKKTEDLRRQVEEAKGEKKE